LDYSTARTSGSLWFQVNIKDVNQNTIIQGKTDPVGVSPGKILPTVFLVASPCVDPKNPDQTHADQPNAGPCNGS
jgi:hypothetical protein